MFVTKLLQVINSAFASPPDLRFDESPRFDAASWDKYLHIKVADIPVPQSLLFALDEPCPFWPEHKVRQTHLLCLVPGELTTEQLWQVGASQCLPHSVKDLTVPRKPYWALITKKTIPNSRTKSVLEVQHQLEHSQYSIPTILEASLAVLALHASQNIQIYSFPAGYTRCQEETGGFPIAIGSESAGHLGTFMNDWDAQSGIAVVLK